MEGNEQGSIEKLMEQFHVYNDQRNHQKAKEILEIVLEIQMKELGEDDLCVAYTLTIIGTVLLREGTYNEALEKHNRALEIQLKKLGGKHVDTADTYEAMGRVFLEQENNLEKAEEMFRKALDINLEILPQNDSDLMDLYQLLAISLKMQCKFSEATKIQKLMLVTLLQMYGEYHPDVVKSYIGIAMLLTNQNRLDDALQMLAKSIEICSRLQRLGDFDTNILGGALLIKAKCLQSLGNLEGATEAFTNLKMIQKETLGEMHPSTAETYQNLARAYDRQDRTEDAIKAYTKAINIRKAVLGDSHPRTKEVMIELKFVGSEKNARALNEQGMAMKAQGDSEKAIQFFHEALGVFNEFYRAHPYMAEIYENISDVKVEQGLLEDGVAASAEALKMRRRALGDDHIDTKRRMEAHRSLLKRLLKNRS
jgi:tetratricopeptide (TPR) repeat protein